MIHRGASRKTLCCAGSVNSVARRTCRASSRNASQWAAPRRTANRAVRIASDRWADAAFRVKNRGIRAGAPPGRIQCAFTVIFHVIFPSFSIGLASYLAVLEALWVKTGRLALKPQLAEAYRMITRLTRSRPR